MRLSPAFQSALAGWALSVSQGFVVRPTTLVRVPFALHGIDKGWDNDNFLEALSRGSGDINDANEQYKKQSDLRAERRAAEGVSDDSPAGSRFNELLNKAKETVSKPGEGPILYNPLEGVKSPAIAPPTPAIARPSASPSDGSLSVEEQARMFREMMANQAQAPPTLQPQRRTEPRRQGRNRDADTISNTADLYFAQLKRDSSVRTIARYTGDTEKANAVFQDEGVLELNDLIKTNPYLNDPEKQKGLLDTTGNELIGVMKMTAGSGVAPPQDFAVPSYKEKLAEKKKKQVKQQAPSARVQETAAVAEAPSTPVQETPAVVEAPPVVTQAAPAPRPTHTLVSEPASVVPPNPVQAVQSAPAAEADDASKTVRHNIRTLMGLILKHRGGPGFGAGRLKAAEAERFETLLGEVTEMLRSEALLAPSTSGAELKVEPAQSVTPPQPPPPQQQVAPSVQQLAPPAQAAMMAPPSFGTMTFSGPPPVDDRMSRTMACVEGAVQMYKNSPPEIQEGILMPLRGALMAAVNTCNQVIAEKELENFQNYRNAAPPVENAQQPSTPAQFFEVTPYTPADTLGEEATEPVTESPAMQIVSGTDENTKFLQTVYDKLVASSGDEKFGLGKLSSAEATALADQVVEMKAILIEELESGIPEAVEISSGSSSTDGSRYLQMLSKAKAAKSA